MSEFPKQTSKNYSLMLALKSYPIFPPNPHVHPECMED